ncbi:MAG: hypothetical protein EAZ45_00730 [Oscillatoriales cyanobacterium]|nr:MAG: hypothetical protein EAZ45_00730 [Oscillatoriales cyanobacterium]
MKSLVRLGAILGIVGCTLLGPSPIAKMSALALPVPQVVEKLSPVPVFTITDGQNAFFITTVPKQGQGQTGNASVARIFISQKDAQAFVDQLKTGNPQLAADQVLFAFIPAAQQVQSAKTVLQQTGQQVSELNGVPLFVARGGPENGYLTIQRGDKEELPLFFNKEDLQEMVERFKQQQPNVTATIKIEVVNLERILEALGTENDPSLSQMILIPSRESLEYLRSRQPAGTGNQNPQAAPSPAPARPAASPAPARPAASPAPARPAR